MQVKTPLTEARINKSHKIHRVNKEQKTSTGMYDVWFCN